MLAIFVDLGLEEYIEKGAGPPESDDIAEQQRLLKKWKQGDAKAKARIELAISDAEMVHIMGAETAQQMWAQLTMVKEPKGRLGILAARRALYRSTADEGVDIIEHISKIRQMQEELHVMGNKIPDEDFTMILLTSLPESWDVFTTSFLGSSGNKPDMSSQELIGIIIDEARRKKDRQGGSMALQATFKGKRDATKKECFNCHKLGHFKEDCWAKGGGKEGQGPKGRSGKHRANQAQETSESLNNIAYMGFNGTDFSNYDWLLDCGSTSHICNIRDAFVDYYPINDPKEASIHGIGPTAAVARGRGTVNVDFTVNGNVIRHHLINVFHIPEAQNNLISLGRIDDGGGHVTFQKGKCLIRDKDDNIIGIGHKTNKLYKLEARAIQLNQERTNYASSAKLGWDQWHRRFGHIAISAIQQLDREGLVTGLDIDRTSNPPQTCESCIPGKQHRKKFPAEATHRSNTAGERLMADLWGPISVKSIGGFKLFMGLMDDSARYGQVIFLQDKSQAAVQIENHCERIKNRTGKYPRWIRVDNGREFVNQRVKDWTGSKGIELETTAPYSSSQNGVAERFNRTLLDLARTMLLDKKLPDFLWDEAVSHACYIRNRAPTRALKGKTPYEAWFGKKPDVSHFREFGCDVWVLDETENLSKIKPRSKKMVFMGFNDGSKSIRYYDPTKRNIKVSRNVAFHENDDLQPWNTSVPGLLSEGESPSQIIPPPPKQIPQVDSNIQTVEAIPPQIEPPEPRQLRPRIPMNYNINKLSKATVTPHHEHAQLAINDPITEWVFLAMEEDLPKNFDEAIGGDEVEKWKEAMDDELGNIEKMGTWELMDLPPNRSPIGCRWVYAKKTNEKGEVVKHKARLVAQGFSQKPGIDYSNDGTFAPVMRFETLRTSLALATVNGWDLRQFDVKGAYLNGYIEEEIYMRQPPGFDDGSGRVCRLRRSLYGLKQAGNVWNKELDTALQNLGFTRLQSDNCCYLRETDRDFEILMIWVDDILSMANNRLGNDRVETDLGGKFEINSLGRPSKLLGMQINIDPSNHSISISQTSYIDMLLKKFGLDQANPVTTPLDPNVKFDSFTKSDVIDKKSITGYAQLIGSLMYLAIGTRPDIAFAVNKLAQFSSDPTTEHWTAVKRIFRYLKGTRSHALTYGGRNTDLSEDLNIFCDADWGSSHDRKSTSGYVLTIAGGAVAWSSKKQATVALSTPEAEYIAVTHVARQVLWHRSLLTELGIQVPPTLTIFSDNQGACAISHNPEFHARTKHIDIAYHFLRDLVRSKILDVVYVNTLFNLADIFTKGLPRDRHDILSYKIGIIAE